MSANMDGLVAAVVLVLPLCVQLAGSTPTEPFEVYWNVQTQGRYGCKEKFDIDIDVQQYGIHENSGAGTDGWTGEEITILYNIHNGDHVWPFITREGHSETPGVWHNGGIPQSGDIESFKDKMRAYIEDKVPEGSVGLCVLDFEEWRATYEMNSGTLKFIQEASKNKVRNETTGLSEEEIEAKATEEFDTAASEFLEAALDVGQSTRPDCRWGYFHYPYCFYDNHGDYPDLACKPISYDFTDDLPWMAEKSDILYPSSYYFANTKEEKKIGWVNGTNDVAYQWLQNVDRPYTPVYHYNKFQISMPEPFYSERDLIMSVGVAADQAVGGYVFWGNGKTRDDAETCANVKDYIETTLGPYVQKVREFMQQCSDDLCSGNGRCHKNYISMDVNDAVQNVADDHNYDAAEVANDYHCVCYEGYSGNSCA